MFYFILSNKWIKIVLPSLTPVSRYYTEMKSDEVFNTQRNLVHLTFLRYTSIYDDLGTLRLLKKLKGERLFQIEYVRRNKVF